MNRPDNSAWQDLGFTDELFRDARRRTLAYDGIVVTPERARRMVLEDNFGLDFGSKEWLSSESRALHAQFLSHRNRELARLVGDGRMIYIGELPDGREVIAESNRALALFGDAPLPHPFADGYVVMANGGVTELIAVEPTTARVITDGRPGGPERHAVSLMVFRAEREHSTPPCDDFWLVSDGVVAFGDGDFFIEPHGSIPLDVPMETKTNYLVSYASIVLYALLLMSTRFVETETVEMPAKLARARAKAGKAPLPSYLRVRSEDYVTALMMRGGGARVGGGGTHASPLPHVRRAHIRRLSDRQVLVREARVNMAKGRMGSATRAFYELKMPKER